MLLGLDQPDGAAFPPRAEAGDESDSFLEKMGAGFGVPGLCEGYLTAKLGRAWHGAWCVSPARATGLLKRGVPRLKGKGLGLCIFAAGGGRCCDGELDMGDCRCSAVSFDGADSVLRVNWRRSARLC